MSIAAYGAFSFVLSIVTLLALLAGLIIAGVQSRGTSRLLGVLGFAALLLGRVISVLGTFVIARSGGGGVGIGLFLVSLVNALLFIIGIILIALALVVVSRARTTPPAQGSPPGYQGPPPGFQRPPPGYGPQPGPPGPPEQF